MQCTNADCDRDAECRGFCAKHYQQWRIGPDFVRRVTPTPGRCSVAGCANVEKAGGLCNTHYQRQRRAKLYVACTPPHRTHTYSLRNRCIHCGFVRIRKYVNPAKKLLDDC